MNKKRKIRPIGVAVLALIIAVPIFVVALLLGGTPKTEKKDNNVAVDVSTPSVSTRFVKPSTTVPVSTEPVTTEPEPTEPEPTEPTTTTAPPTTVPPTTTTQFDPVAKGNAIVSTAKSKFGTPWVHGGTGPDGFDNSGFVYYVYRQNGINMPRSTSAIIGYGTAVSKNDLRVGDVVVFSLEIGGPANFVGVYAGDGQWIGSFSSTTPTMSKPLTDGSYWGQRFVSGRRVF